MKTLTARLRDISWFRWNPNKDLAAVIVSWLLVVGAIYSATVVVGQNIWGGFAYFIVYAVLGATLFGIGIPLYWMVVVRKKTIAELGITKRFLGLSLVLQFVFAALQYIGALTKGQLPSFEKFLPLVALALAIGFFEAIFWRGWVLLRLEEAFGIIPAILLGSAFYALYHIGYGMPSTEMFFLYFIGIMFAVTFRLTKNIFLLWPFFQPMGQLVTLVKDRLNLPLIAAVGFIEALILMFVLVWLAARYQKKHQQSKNLTQTIDA